MPDKTAKTGFLAFCAVQPAVAHGNRGQLLFANVCTCRYSSTSTPAGPLLRMLTSAGLCFFAAVSSLEGKR